MDKIILGFVAGAAAAVYYFKEANSSGKENQYFKNPLRDHINDMENHFYQKYVDETTSNYELYLCNVITYEEYLNSSEISWKQYSNIISYSDKNK